jgi:hypothetical protein
VKNFPRDIKRKRIEANRWVIMSDLKLNVFRSRVEEKLKLNILKSHILCDGLEYFLIPKLNKEP